jgi:hypothetical protein
MEEIHIPSRSEVAAASRPKKAIVTEMRRQKIVKTDKPYKPTKLDVAPQKTINWKSPTFWPVIEMAARQQLGKPNINKLLDKLQQQDQRFTYLSHQRISEWRDRSIKDHFEWTEETIASVKKEFLPGGHQTRYNVFVSTIE